MAGVLLLDIGNTHTHVGWAHGGRLRRVTQVDTAGWARGEAAERVDRWVRSAEIEGAVMASVVPQVTPWVRRYVRRRSDGPCVLFTAQTRCGLEINYPDPSTIGADRLANALAARRRCGAPVLVLDFGTALTLDAVDARGRYVGGVIAPGLAAMTGYLPDRTALLPRIRLREVSRRIGRNTAEAMRIGILEGYRGLVRHLIRGILEELGEPQAPVIATGGCAKRVVQGLREVRAVVPTLTLEGLLEVWQASPRPTVAARAAPHRRRTATATMGMRRHRKAGT